MVFVLMINTVIAEDIYCDYGSIEVEYDSNKMYKCPNVLIKKFILEKQSDTTNLIPFSGGGIGVGVECNYNGICESELDEDWFNCRCDPFKGECGNITLGNGDCTFTNNFPSDGYAGYTSAPIYLRWISIVAISLAFILWGLPKLLDIRIRKLRHSNRKEFNKYLIKDYIERNKNTSFYCMTCDCNIKEVSVNKDNFIICKECNSKVNIIVKDKEEMN